MRIYEKNYISVTCRRTVSGDYDVVIPENIEELFSKVAQVKKYFSQDIKNTFKLTACRLRPVWKKGTF